MDLDLTADDFPLETQDIKYFKQIKKTFETNLLILEGIEPIVETTEQNTKTLKKQNELINGMIQMAENLKTRKPEQFSDALDSIKQELDTFAKLIYDIFFVGGGVGGATTVSS